VLSFPRISNGRVFYADARRIHDRNTALATIESPNSADAAKSANCAE
jgi:hypothetical protein